MGPGTIHSIEVQSPSTRDETIAVLRLSFAIVLAGLAALAITRDAAVSSDRPATLFPFQRLFRELAPPEQRAYRELRETMIEAARWRSEHDAWPGATELVELGVLPATNEWTASIDERGVTYLGRPRSEGRPNFLLRIEASKDAETAAAQPAAKLDEEHHRLAGGAIVHVGIWMNDRPAPGKNPLAEGWTQILMGRSKQ